MKMIHMAKANVLQQDCGSQAGQDAPGLLMLRRERLPTHCPPCAPSSAPACSNCSRRWPSLWAASSWPATLATPLPSESGHYDKGRKQHGSSSVKHVSSRVAAALAFWNQGHLGTAMQCAVRDPCLRRVMSLKR